MLCPVYPPHGTFTRKLNNLVSIVDNPTDEPFVVATFRIGQETPQAGQKLGLPLISALTLRTVVHPGYAPHSYVKLLHR